MNGVSPKAESVPNSEDVMENSFQSLLNEAVRFHGHLCGGQVLGVRMAIAGLREIGISDPRGKEGRDLVLFFEIDRCIADAIITVTGRTPGKRSVRMMDYGKMAATFTETQSGRSVRISLKPDSNEKIKRLAQTYTSMKEVRQPEFMAMTEIAEADLFNIQKVFVQMRPQDLPGEPMDIVICRQCGETVRDMRHVNLGGRLLCKPCAQGKSYYTLKENALPEPELEGCIEPERKPNESSGH